MIKENAECFLTPLPVSTENLTMKDATPKKLNSKTFKSSASAKISQESERDSGIIVKLVNESPPRAQLMKIVTTGKIFELSSVVLIQISTCDVCDIRAKNLDKCVMFIFRYKHTSIGERVQ